METKQELFEHERETLFLKHGLVSLSPQPECGIKMECAFTTIKEKNRMDSQKPSETIEYKAHLADYCRNTRDHNMAVCLACIVSRLKYNLA